MTQSSLPPAPQYRNWLVENQEWQNDILRQLYFEQRIVRNILETLMAQHDDLLAASNASRASITALATAFGDLATSISTQIQQLVDAFAHQNDPDPTVAQVITDLQSQKTDLDALAAQAASLKGSLDADDPAAPTP